MFGFSTKSDDLRALNQRLGKLLNSVHYTNIEAERQRTESRTRLAQPCIMFPFEEARMPQSYAVGVTCDISLRGLSLLTQDAIKLADYVLSFGFDDCKVLVKATCQRCVQDRFGMFAVGFQFRKLLQESAYPAILSAIELVDTPATARQSSNS